MPTNSSGQPFPRRWCLRLLTLAAVVQVIAGVTVLKAALDTAPLWFVLYWTCCLVIVMAILLTAALEIRSVRREHRQQRRELNQELAQIITEAKTRKQNR